MKTGDIPGGIPSALPAYVPPTGAAGPAAPPPAAPPAAPPQSAIDAWIASNPSGSPVWLSPSAVSAVPAAQPNLTSTIKDALASDPNLKQQQQWLDQQHATDVERAKQQAAWNEQEYQLQLQSLASGGGGGGNAGEAQQTALDQLAKDKAAHELALQQKAAQEGLASRGMADSGQAPFVQGELKYAYDNLLKQIDLAAEARHAQQAASQSAAGAGRATAGARLELAHQQDLIKAQWAIQDLNSKYAVDSGQLIMTTGQRLAAAYFNSDTGVYEGPGGERWDKYGNPILATPLPSVNSLLGGYAGGPVTLDPNFLR